MRAGLYHSLSKCLKNNSEWSKLLYFFFVINASSDMVWHAQSELDNYKKKIGPMYYLCDKIPPYLGLKCIEIGIIRCLDVAKRRIWRRSAHHYGDYNQEFTILYINIINSGLWLSFDDWLDQRIVSKYSVLVYQFLYWKIKKKTLPTCSLHIFWKSNSLLCDSRCDAEKGSVMTISNMIW